MCKDVVQEILHEIRVLLISSPCNRIIQLFSVFETSNEYVLILELASGGELQQVLDMDEYLTEEASRHVVRQVLEGISFLHDHSIAHLDIKPQNILLTGPLTQSSISLPSSSPDSSSSTSSSPTLTPCHFCDIKICDFGVSRVISHGYDLREILGTPDYVAPEILNYDPISLATDMWSMGCLSYVVLSGCSPFGGEDKQETLSNITSAPLDFDDAHFDSVSELALDFIRKLIVREPKLRLTAKEALDHDWIKTSSPSSST